MGLDRRDADADAGVVSGGVEVERRGWGRRG